MADWTGDSSPSSPAIPSTVVTSLPSVCTANIRQAAHRLSVEQHRAGAACAVLAPEMRPSEPALFAKIIREGQPRLDGPLGGHAR